MTFAGVCVARTLVFDMARYIGVEVKKEPDLLWIAKQAVQCALPPNWVRALTSKLHTRRSSHACLLRSGATPSFPFLFIWNISNWYERPLTTVYFYIHSTFRFRV